MNDTVNAALDYVQRGFALTWMEHGTKRPTHPGWNTPENVITTSEQVRRKFGNGQALNIGLVHQFSTPRTCSLDVDQSEYTRLALAEVGIDLDAVRQGVPCVVGNPKGFRLEYRQPDGENLPLRKLQWTDKSGRKIPVFELRAGANHDCLPPSLHPSGKLYEWTTPLPVDPAAHPTPNTALLEIWRNWSAWEPVLQAASPWAQTPEPAPRSREARADVIGAFNKAHEVRQILEAHGYKPRGKRRYLPPNSTSGVPSVRILDSGMVFSDNGSCPLNDGRAHDAFDCYRILEHGGDFRAATKAAAELLGMARLNSAPTGGAQGAAADESEQVTDNLVPPPRLDESMLYGLAGDVAKAASETTEANPVAVSAGFLTYISAMVGRDVYLPVGNVFHHARLFTLHVGRSGRGRKGDALSIVHRIRWAMPEHFTPHEKMLSEAKPSAGPLGQAHTGGLSSREGLAWLIRDKTAGKNKKGKEIVTDDGIPDKRLWVAESEFANVLQQSKRDGNTLSSALRDAWDGQDLKPATKNNRTWASDPHIAISGAITPSELLAMVERRELTSGFCGRFLVFYAERVRLEPSPSPTPENVLNDLAERTLDVIRFAKGDYPNTHNTRRARLAPSTEETYRELYMGELSQPIGNDLLDALLERRAAYLLRLALLFAITDQSLMIERHHIEAALAWVRYWVQSVRYIFWRMADGTDGHEAQEHGEKILAFLRGRKSANRASLSVECFGRHATAKQLDAALEGLLANGRIVRTEEKRADGKVGRGKAVYSLRELSEISEVRVITKENLSSQPCEISEVRVITKENLSSQPCEVSEVRVITKENLSSQPCEVSVQAETKVRKVRTPCEIRNDIEPRLISQSSQSSPNTKSKTRRF